MCWVRVFACDQTLCGKISESSPCTITPSAKTQRITFSYLTAYQESCPYIPLGFCMSPPPRTAETRQQTFFLHLLSMCPYHTIGVRVLIRPTSPLQALHADADGSWLGQASTESHVCKATSHATSGSCSYVSSEQTGQIGLYACVQHALRADTIRRRPRIHS